jgi:hypothetical protein
VTRAGTVRVLVGLFGVVAIVAGLVVLVGGPDADAGGEHVGASLDSELRFFNAIWVGFGAFALWQALRGDVPQKTIAVIAAVLFVGGLGRIVSLVAEGRPDTIYVALMVIELCSPALLLLRPRRTRRR